MPFLVTAGSLTVVAKTFKEAELLRLRFQRDTPEDVIIADERGARLSQQRLDELRHSNRKD
jgi:hypothetical protein